MVIYIDVLLFLNMFVNFFILHITSLLSKSIPNIWRQILGAAVGALFSLCIFIPINNIFFECLIRLVSSMIIVFSCYGYNNFKSYISKIAIFYASSFLFVGIMMGLWFVFKSPKIAINAGVVYFNVSTEILLLSTLVSYILIKIFRKISSRHAPNARRCNIEIFLENRSYSTVAMVDTGHSLNDLFSASPIIVVDEKVIKKLALTDNLGDLQLLYRDRYRIIPYKTINSEGAMPAIRCDTVSFTINNTKKEIKKPIIAVSDVTLGEDYSAIINPEMLI